MKVFAVLGTLLLAVCTTSAAMPPAPNVLLITIDDLNDWVTCLRGHPQAKTPNIDALANRGVLFTNAHCNAPICNPSRTSLMTGMRPDTNGVIHNATFFRDTVPDVVTLPEYFGNHGYQSAFIGKIYHPGQTDTGRSWNRPAVKSKRPQPTPSSGLNVAVCASGPSEAPVE